MRAKVAAKVKAERRARVRLWRRGSQVGEADDEPDQETRPGDGRQQENGRGLGEEHAGVKQAHQGGGKIWMTKPGQADGEVERGECAGGKQRLQQRQAAEGVKEWTGDQEGEREQGAPARSGGAKQLVGQQQVDAEEADGNGAGRGEGDAGEEKDQTEQEGPDGHGGGGIEVAGEKPVSGDLGADGGVGPPALVGVLGPVLDPGGVVGKVRRKVQGAQKREGRDDRHPEKKCPASERFLQLVNSGAG